MGDADGQRLSAKQGGTALASAGWNGAGQLTSYSNNAAVMNTATYDGNGLRASTTTTPAGESAVTQGYVWNITPQLPRLIMDSSNAYIYGNGLAPTEQVNLSTGVVTYLVTDMLGSVRGTVNASGSLTGTTNYDAWGNPETPGGLTATTQFGYAGSYTDPTGLIYLIHRYYDPQSGQFLSVDPMVSQTVEPFAYADGNPVSKTDPSGLTFPGGGGNTAFSLHCGHGWYFFCDGDGEMELRYACWAHAVYWWYHIASWLQQIIAGHVAEYGLTYRVNWGPYQQNAPHYYEYKWYWFHGTMSHVRNYHLVKYEDLYYFEIRVGGETGTGDIYVHGYYQAKP